MHHWSISVEYLTLWWLLKAQPARNHQFKFMQIRASCPAAVQALGFKCIICDGKFAIKHAADCHRRQPAFIGTKCASIQSLSLTGPNVSVGILRRWWNIICCCLSWLSLRYTVCGCGAPAHPTPLAHSLPCSLTRLTPSDPGPSHRAASAARAAAARAVGLPRRGILRHHRSAPLGQSMYILYQLFTSCISHVKHKLGHIF